ncbi:MAG: nuclear transport factor 2 family protein [Thermoleophilaceae bacterium]
MASNVEVMKDAYKSFSEGHGESAVGAFHEDAVWQGSNSTELPGGGETSGKEGIGGLLQSVGSDWDEFNLTPDEFFESDDTVVVLLHSDVKKGDQSGQLPVVHIARFEDGKIKRFQAITDTLYSAQLLGLIGGKPPEEE